VVKTVVQAAAQITTLQLEVELRIKVTVAEQAAAVVHQTLAAAAALVK
jgi:hypothetical protein